MRVLLVLLLLTLPVLAQDFTPEEITKLKAIVAQHGSETLPLEIEKLRKQRENIIVERDALLYQEDVECQSEKQVIIKNYETQIDAIEANIDSKQSLLDSLIVQ